MLQGTAIHICQTCDEHKVITEFPRYTASQVWYECRDCIDHRRRKKVEAKELYRKLHTRRYQVYRITNTVTGQTYIGYTSQALAMRYSNHLSRAFRGTRSSALYVAMRATTRAEAESVWQIAAVQVCGSKNEAQELEAALIRQESLAMGKLCLNQLHRTDQFSLEL